MVEHERTHAAQDAAPDTDQFPAQEQARTPDQQSTPRSPEVPQTPQAPRTTQAERPGSPRVEQAYRRARHASGWWVRMAIAVIVLVVLLVFIIENLQTVNIAFFGAHWQLPLGVAILLAAVCGVLLVLVPSFGRIIQLRRTLRQATTGK